MTQQEWKWLKKSLVLDLGWGGSTERILEHIIAAYPSSPQGLAAKALADLLVRVRVFARKYPWTGLADAKGYVEGIGLLRDIDAALAAKDVTP